MAFLSVAFLFSYSVKTMSNIPNIKTQGTSEINSGSSDTGNNTSGTDTTNKNKTDFANLEALRTTITSQSSIATDAKTQAEQYASEAKNASSIEALKDLIRMAKEKIAIMRESIAQAKEAKTELAQNSQSVPGIQGDASVETQDDFLFNQKPDNAIDI